MTKPLKQCETKVVNGVKYTGGQVPPENTATKKNSPAKEKGGKNDSTNR